MAYPLVLLFKLVRIIFLVLTIPVLALTSKTAFASNVLLNEIMANPSDNTEWVELYNPTDQTVDLSNWKIKDGNSLSSDDLILTGQINPTSFVTFDHAKGWLNDSGSETVTLLDNNDQTLDSYTYSGTTKGKTYGRQPDGLNWIADLEPSKNSSNGEQPSPTPSPTPTPTPSPTPTPTPSPTPTPNPSPSPTPKKTASPTAAYTPPAALKNTSTLTANKESSLPQPKNSSQIQYRLASVAAAATTATPEAKVVVQSQKQTNPFLWAGLILIFTGVSVIGYIYLKKNGKIPF